MAIAPASVSPTPRTWMTPSAHSSARSYFHLMGCGSLTFMRFPVVGSRARFDLTDQIGAPVLVLTRIFSENPLFGMRPQQETAITLQRQDDSWLLSRRCVGSLYRCYARKRCGGTFRQGSRLDGGGCLTGRAAALPAPVKAGFLQQSLALGIIIIAARIIADRLALVAASHLVGAGQIANRIFQIGFRIEQALGRTRIAHAACGRMADLHQTPIGPVASSRIEPAFAVHNPAHKALGHIIGDGIFGNE